MRQNQRVARVKAGIRASSWIALAMCASVAWTAGAAETAPAPTPSVSPGAASPMPSATPSSAASVTPLTRAEERTLRYEFQRALAGERQALVHRQRTEMRELKASQEARLKEWQMKESAARREYFKSHTGPEKRAYMKDLQARRKVLIGVLAEERATRVREQEVRMRSVREDQKLRLEEFQAALKRQERPAERLWPTGH